MTGNNGEYINGYLERSAGGNYEGRISVEGIDLSPITGVMFKQDNKSYLWLRRKDILEYDYDQQRYISRKREPRWEAYLEKQMDGNVVAFKGEFLLMRFRFSITGVWDGVFGKDKSRINFFVDRVPMDRQDIIQGLSKRNEVL